MGILSKQDEFSDGQAITATAASTNIIDLGATGTPAGSSVALVRDIGKGGMLPMEVLVTEAFNNLTSLEVQLEVDDNSSFSSAKLVASTGAIALAKLVKGYRLPFPAEVPEGTDERYFRLRYVVVGTAPTTGKISAGIVAGRQNNG